MSSSAQLLELVIVLCTIVCAHHAVCKTRSGMVNAQAKSGPVQPDSMPSHLSNLISPLQGVTYFLFPAIYVISVVSVGFRQPQWLKAFAVPEVVFGVELEGARKNALRLLAGIICIPGGKIADNVLEHLGDQYHPIGRREKQRVVQTGPYAWVRHPLYTLLLLQVVLQCFMFWSYVPLFELVANAILIAIKIPIEEEAIQRDDGIREEYRAYMRRVPTRLVPYVW